MHNAALSNKKIKLLLLNAINTQSASERVFPNLGLGYISGYLKKHLKDIDVKIIDTDGSDIEKVFKEYAPSLVGISSVSQNFDLAGIAAGKCASLSVPAFIGGIHISTLPESLPAGCHAGVIGEGEETILDLIKCFLNSGRFNNDLLKGINGLVLHSESGGTFLTPPRKFIPDPDSLPFPDRDALGVSKNGFLHLFTSRGCRHRCTFCSNSRFWGKARVFSAEYVFTELAQVMQKYHPRAITFYDDDFLISKERLRKLVVLIEKEGINKKTEFNLMARVDSIDEETILILKRMNVTVISLGIESGSQRTLDYLKSGNVSVEKNQEIIRLLDKAGILTYGFFIIGAPLETEEDIMKTFDFIKQSRLSGFSIYTLVPYPGTPIWDYAKSKGLVSNSMPWGKLALNINEARDQIVVLSEKISSKRLYELYWRFQGLRKRKHLGFMLKRAMKNPALIIPRLARSLSVRIKNL